MSLRLKTLIGVMLLQIALLVVVAANSTSVVMSHVSQQIAAKANTLAHHTAAMAGGALLTYDKTEFQGYIRQLARQDPDIVYIRVFNKYGEKQGEAVTPLPVPADAIDDRKGFEDELAGTVIDRTAPIIMGQSTFGTVEIGISTRAFHLARERMTRQLISIGTVGGVLVMILSLIVSHYLTRRLRNLAGAATKISEGKFNVSLDEPQNDEIGRVATAFNTMAHEIRRQLEELRAGEQRFRGYAESASDWFWEMDLEGRFTFLSPNVDEVLHTNRAAMLGRRREDLMDLSAVDPRELGRYQEAVAKRLPFKDFTYSMRLKNGRVQVRQVSGKPFRDGSGKVVGFRGVGSDITARIAAEEQIRRLAERDSLTGLLNRGMFIRGLDECIARARRQNTSLSVFAIDLDGFKGVNDGLGHPAGDALLTTLGKRLLMISRETDLVARLGGDEFAVVQTDGGEQAATAASALAERILASVGLACDIEGREVTVGASIGIACFPNNGQTANDLMVFADMALYKAKAQGRNTYRFYRPEMNREVQRRKSIEAGIRTGLMENSFTLHYQPQVNLTTGQIDGLEALIRWLHPELGPLAPPQFIPIAEESGLILPLSSWVLRRACEEAVSLRRPDGSLPRLAVNISPVQFTYQNLVEEVEEALVASRFPADHLELEITEGLLMNDSEQAMTIFQRLAALGVGIAIDDFGAGYSNLGYLQRFHIDKLKIDKSFVHPMAFDHNAHKIVAAIASLAHSLDLTLVAEGVETREQAQLLRELGCTLAQGFLFSRPLTFRDARRCFAKSLETPALLSA